MLTQETIAPGRAIFAHSVVKRACGPKAWPAFCREAAKPHGVLEQSTGLFVASPSHSLTTTKGSAVLFIKCRRMPASRHCRRQSARIFLALHQKLPFQRCFAVLRSPQAAKAPVGPLSKLSGPAFVSGAPANKICRVRTRHAAARRDSRQPGFVQRNAARRFARQGRKRWRQCFLPPRARPGSFG